MYYRSSLNYPNRSYVQDNATPISNLFDLRQDKLDSSKLNVYNDVYEDVCNNSYSERRESPLPTYRTPNCEEERLMPNLDCDSKYSPAWKFLKEFNTPDVKEMNPPKKNISDLFDLPHDTKFGSEMGRRERNEYIFDTEEQGPAHNTFPNRGLSKSSEFHDYQAEDFTPTVNEGGQFRSWNKNESDVQYSRANKMKLSSHMGNNVNKVIPYFRPEVILNKKRTFYRNRRRRFQRGFKLLLDKQTKSS